MEKDMNDENRNEECSSLKTWQSEDKPRERLKQYGVQALEDYELLAIMIGTGVRGHNVVDLSKQILSSVEGRLSSLSSYTLQGLMNNFNGIGQAKAMQILAALELGRRRSIETYDVTQICSSIDIANFFTGLLANKTQEELWLLLLNNSNIIVAKQCIGQGGVSNVVTDIKLIIRPAVERLAPAIALCHNHPSGSLVPSADDDQLTEKVKNAAKFFDIRLLDHVIVTPIHNRYYSYNDEGRL